MDVVQSKRKYLADRNDNSADQTRKRSALLPPQSTDPIIGKLKVSACNSICDIESADSASLLMNDDAMNDEDAHFEERDVENIITLNTSDQKMTILKNADNMNSEEIGRASCRERV